MAEAERFEPGLRDYLKFAIPSLFGVFLFVIPIWVEKVKDDGEIVKEITLPVAWLAKWLDGAMGNHLEAFTIGLLIFSAVMTLIVKLTKPKWAMGNEFYKGLFNVNWFWVISRVVGAIFGIMIFWKMGYEPIYHDDTGGVAFNDLASFLVVIFLFAGLFLPLLIDFGLLELCGTLMSKLMRPLFTLPGRSAIDCAASWVGDGTIGVLLTSKQYEAGFYTKREAVVVGTTFSFVSVTFTIVVIETIGLSHLFLQSYLALTVAGIAAAFIVPRIPPLSLVKDTYYQRDERTVSDELPKDVSLLRHGIHLATERAREVEGAKSVTVKGVQNVMEMWLGIVPVVVMLATIANMVANYTQVFNWIGMPFEPLLNMLGVPEADKAGQMFVVGFADMLLPAILSEGAIKSEFTRFVIGTVSCTQLIYMSEIGALLMSSRVPVRFWELVVIFLERTLITLPIVVGMAYLLGIGS
ncbi:YjiH family protein [Planctomycetota bacterium]|nr:YjiH family protein [Planctomycetota bacterium]